MLIFLLLIISFKQGKGQVRQFEIADSTYQNNIASFNNFLVARDFKSADSLLLSVRTYHNWDILHRQETILLYHLYKRDFKTILKANTTIFNDKKYGYYRGNSETHLILTKDFDNIFDDIAKSSLTHEEKDYLYLYCQHLADKYIITEKEAHKIKEEEINNLSEAFIQKYPTSTFLDGIDKNIYPKEHYNNSGAGGNIHYGRNYYEGKINPFVDPAKSTLFGLGLEFSGQKHALFMDVGLNINSLRQDIKIDSLVIPKQFELRNSIFNVNYGKFIELNNSIVLTPFAGYEARTFFPFIADSVIGLPFENEKMNLRYFNVGMNTRFKLLERVITREVTDRPKATALFLGINYNCALPLLNKTIYQPITQAVKISFIFKNLWLVHKPLTLALKSKKNS